MTRPAERQDSAAGSAGGDGLQRALSPQTASVLLGAMCGFLALEWSRAGLPGGLPYLLGGYVAGALVGAGLTRLLGALAGPWWRPQTARPAGESEDGGTRISARERRPSAGERGGRHG